METPAPDTGAATATPRARPDPALPGPPPRPGTRALGALLAGALLALGTPLAGLADDGSGGRPDGHPYTIDPSAPALGRASALVAPGGDEATDADGDTDGAARADAEVLATLERLRYIETVIGERVGERVALGERIAEADEREAEELRERAAELSDEIAQLRRTLESIATGGIDSSQFEQDDEAPEEDGDWRSDLALVAQPVIDSMKELTEKPRRISEQNDLIAERARELEVARRALEGLAPELEFARDEALVATLRSLERRWRKRADDAEAAIEIARFEIANLRGDKPLWRTALDAVVEFATGRGLTLVLAAAAAAGVFYGSRFALSGYRSTLLDRSEPESRTRYRLAAYAMHAGTGLLMLVAVFVVFYQRGDVLLLGLMILLFVGLALGARQVLPQYVTEAKLLLNIGPMREGERIVYRGLPFRVESINMYTVLRNPELHGVIRVPLSDLHDQVSRPSGKDDPWFPSSRGDVVLLDPDDPCEVIDQNPDTVSLRARGGQILQQPAADFYRRATTNLSRGGTFGVEARFGIDYAEQAEAVDGVPKALRGAIRDALAGSDVAGRVRDVVVELERAGESSLVYWTFVTMDAGAAKSWLRIRRLVQHACVQACTERGWTIPFPHLSIVAKAPVAVVPEARRAA